MFENMTSLFVRARLADETSGPAFFSRAPLSTPLTRDFQGRTLTFRGFNPTPKGLMKGRAVLSAAAAGGVVSKREPHHRRKSILHGVGDSILARQRPGETYLLDWLGICTDERDARHELRCRHPTRHSDGALCAAVPGVALGGSAGRRLRRADSENCDQRKHERTVRNLGAERASRACVRDRIG